MADELAIFGGPPVRRHPFPRYPVIGERERRAVLEVLDQGVLSGFHNNFLGGPKVQAFEQAVASMFGVRHAIAVNSGTAALHVALAAAGVGAGDEVIVPCYTFTATATAVLHHNAIPIFIDVDPSTFCITAETIDAAITRRTKAVIPVHLLGNVCRMDAILDVAARRHLVVIEDTAQAPGAKFRGRFAGTIGDAGTLSFVETKNLVTGEGGMVLTNREDLAERGRLLRNHGECYVAGKPRAYLANILGWNYRMTELEAAIGLAQLEQFPAWTDQRITNANYLTEHLALPGLATPRQDPDNEHVYHLYALLYDEDLIGLPRELFVRALAAEGIPCSLGYPHPLYRNPLFQEGTAYGERGCPFTCRPGVEPPRYRDLNLPVAEALCRRRMIWTDVIRPPATRQEMQDVVCAIDKVYAARERLRDANASVLAPSR